MNTLLLLLLDSRAPAGAHHHSGGMEAAIGTGLVSTDPARGLADLEDFCRARLRTSARVAAAFAAAAARLHTDSAERAGVPAPSPPRAVPAESWSQENWAQENWALLDAEFDARTPSEATRAASRQLGGGLLRLLRSVLPDADLVTPWAQCAGPAPHHPLVLGAPAVLWMLGGPPQHETYLVRDAFERARDSFGRCEIGRERLLAEDRQAARRRGLDRGEMRGGPRAHPHRVARLDHFGRTRRHRRAVHRREHRGPLGIEVVHGAHGRIDHTRFDHGL